MAGRAVSGIAAVLGIFLAMAARAEGAGKPPIGDSWQGRRYAVQYCASCHDVRSRSSDTATESAAPSFHAVANAKTTSAIGLNVFLVSPHRAMPNFIISAKDRRNVIAYILSLRHAATSGPT